MKVAVWCSEALSPRLYGLPKIYKPDVPLRPIISTIGSPTYNLAKHLTDLLRPYIGQTETYERNSSHLLEKIGRLVLQPEDLMDAISLFTMIPVQEVLDHIADYFLADVTALFRQVLTMTYFQYNGDIYEIITGVVMGSPLRPVVVNCYMEKFEWWTISSTPLKLRCWFRYVDDMFVIWNHREEELGRFLAHLYSVHPQI